MGKIERVYTEGTDFLNPALAKWLSLNNYVYTNVKYIFKIFNTRNEPNKNIHTNSNISKIKFNYFLRILVFHEIFLILQKKKSTKSKYIRLYGG